MSCPSGQGAGDTLPNRETLIDLILRETTDNIVADGWEQLGKPNILVQGCRYVRNDPKLGYLDPEEAARKFAGFIADGFLALLPQREGWRPIDENAPKDGKSVDLWVVINNGIGEERGERYPDAKWLQDHDGRGWWADRYHNTLEWSREAEPEEGVGETWRRVTHWTRPAPPAPGEPKP